MSPTSRNRAKAPSARERLRRGFQAGRAGRVSNRELRRQALNSIREGGKLYAIFLTVLSQLGGEVTVTQGTIEQVGQNMAHLGYVIVPGEAKNEFIVRMVEGKEEEAAPLDTSLAGDTGGTV